MIFTSQEPKHNKVAAVQDASTGSTAGGQNVNKQVTGEKQHHKTKGKSLPKLKIGLWNVRSLCKKATDIHDYILQEDFDILCCTETWLTGTARDDVYTAAVKPPGYEIKHIPRTSGMGGGVGIIHRDSCSVKSAKSPVYKSFEHMTARVVSGSSLYHIFYIYRPPPSSVNLTN